MDNSKKLRTYIRSKVTRLTNELHDLLQVHQPNKNVIEARRIALLETYGALKQKDLEIIEAMCLQNCSEETVENESISCDEYENKVLETLQEVALVLSPPRSASPAASDMVVRSECGRTRTFKLPKIELRKFNGELKEWLSWWSQFEKIHTDETLHDSDKIQYLVQSMLPGTRARDLVDSYPHSADNYPRIIDSLKERFGNEKLLKQVYVRELLKLVIDKSNCSRAKDSVSLLYDRLESQLRALETLHVNPEQMVIFLYPMVESSLPDDVLIAWQRSNLYGQDEGNLDSPELLRLMKFLKREVEAESQRALTKSGFGTQSANVNRREKPKFQRPEDKIPTASGLLSAQSAECLFCGKAHESQLCIAAQSMSMDEKQGKIRSKGACYTCLKPGHSAKHCKSATRCIVCHKRHVVLMCPDLKKSEKLGIQNLSKPAPTNKASVDTVLASPVCTAHIILQTLQLTLIGNGTQKQVRALIDSGSQRSYILKKTVQDLGLEPTAEEKVCHVLFGGSCETKCHKRYKVALQNHKGGFTHHMELLDQDRICGSIPRVCKGPWMRELKFKKIWVSDLGEGTPEIDVLIGSDFLGDILTGKRCKLQNGLTAIQTRFGWTLMGKVSSPQKDTSVGMMVTSMLISDASIPDLWRLETIGIQDPVEHHTKEERNQLTRQFFMKTVSRSEEGRYSVRLPWIEGEPDLPDNRNIAEKRLLYTTNKLKCSGYFDAYDITFKSWLEEGYIEEVPQAEEMEKAYYLPHRAVIKKESQTTPVRPVFDASCKFSRAPSLNECLETGPNLLDLIPSVLLRFREGRIGVTSDIRKAFLQIEVNEQDRDYLRFIWWDSARQGKQRIFRHKRVVFGVNSSPFLLSAVIELHLQNVGGDSETADMFTTSQKLKKSFYVDNCVTSVDTFEELKRFQREATFIMSRAGMELRQWDFGTSKPNVNGQSHESCVCQLSTPKEMSNVLGLQWNKKTDSLSLCCEVLKECDEKTTKRSILSRVSKIFDPLGFLSPALVEPKLIIQEAWAERCKWDEEIRQDLKHRFQKWCEEAHRLQEVQIPRNATGGNNSRRTWQIHVFCDASKYAYAAAVFLRTVDDKRNVSMQLLQAKVRVAPLKRPTIPRLELLACTVGARLTKSVQEALDLMDTPLYFWSDSTTAIAWIKRNDQWGTFVGNRVREICSITNPDCWRHVPGCLNPADLPSRGCTPAQLLASRWWEGPLWLRENEEKWPNEIQAPDEDAIALEKPKVTICNVVTSSVDIPWYARRFSSYRKNVRVIAWIRRFCSNSLKLKPKMEGDISVHEFEQAELTVIKLIQSEVFPQGENIISGLHVLRTEDGLTRVKTQLIYRDDSFGFRLPVLLPRSHPMIKLLIQQEHEENGHAGTQYLLGKLREKYWILQSRRAVKRVISSCVRCRRLSAKSVSVDPAPLPEDRVKCSRVFETVGVDLAGPLFLKDKSKAWIVLFTCAVYRCVHLELVTSLSTESFLWALDRFIKRRGRPVTIYSDNGTNFQGASNAFETVDWKRIVATHDVQRIQWKFIPPSAPWWGGWWERLIRSVKDLLKRMLGRSTLCYQELLTVLCDAEAIINGRPLTCVSEDQTDLIPLTPAMFLQETENVEFPELNAVLRKNPQAKYRYIDTLRKELRMRFKKEYLSLLVQKGKEIKTRKLKSGDIILVGSDHKKRLEWPIAKVEELLLGKDGVARVAKVRTVHGQLIRPLQRLYPLEFQPSPELPSPAEDKRIKKDSNELSSNTSPKQKKSVITTASGRNVRAPVRYGI